MLNAKKLLPVLVLAFVCYGPPNLIAQTGDMFWSDRGLGEGAVNGHLDLIVEAGTSHTLYLYWSTNGPTDSDLETGGFVDVVTTQPGVIEFASAETLNFDITVVGNVISQRWDPNLSGPAGAVSSDFIDELFAVSTVVGTGILESQTGPIFLDQGYDGGADAFQFARIEFDALEAGTVDLQTIVGAGGFLSGGTFFEPTLLGATIQVVPVPEPTSAMVFAVMGISGLLGRRR